MEKSAEAACSDSAGRSIVGSEIFPTVDPAVAFTIPSLTKRFAVSSFCPTPLLRWKIQLSLKESWLTKSDRKSTRLNSSHVAISYAVFCLKKKNKKLNQAATMT